MKKTVKIIMVIIAILSIVLMFSSNVFATDKPADAATGTEIDASSLQADFSKGNTQDLTNMTQRVMGIIRNIAVIAGVIILMIIGVKFIMGSAEEKAEYKKSLMPLVIGIVLVMTATSIVSFLFTFMGD